MGGGWRYTRRVTAKEVLLERVEALTEEEAAEALDLLGFTDSPDREFPPASEEVMALFRKAMADSEAGRSISHEDFRRKHGLP